MISIIIVGGEAVVEWFAYSSGGLVDAAAGHGEIGLDVDGMVSTLLGLVTAPEVFGTLPEALSFGAAVDRSREQLGRSALLDVAARDGLAQRVSVVARLGEVLDVETGEMAAGATPALSSPGSILEGMGG